MSNGLKRPRESYKAYERRMDYLIAAMHRSYDECTHGCERVDLLELDHGAVVGEGGPFPLCIAKEVVERFPGHFRVP